MKGCKLNDKLVSGLGATRVLLQERPANLVAREANVFSLYDAFPKVPLDTVHVGLEHCVRGECILLMYINNEVARSFSLQFVWRVVIYGSFDVIAQLSQRRPIN